MPKYAYFCDECDAGFEAKHSIQKTLEICKLCNASDSIRRIPSLVFINKKQEHFTGKNKPGTLLKATIEETKEEISQEKERLRSRVHKNDD